MMLSSSIFIAVGIWGIVTGNISQFISWLSVIFFGLSYPAGIHLLINRKNPAVVINEAGILCQRISKEVIPWEVIKKSYPMGINGKEFVCLDVDEQYEHSSSKGWWSRNIEQVNKAVGAQKFNIPLGQTNVKAAKLAAFILLVRNVPKENRKETIKSYNCQTLTNIQCCQ